MKKILFVLLSVVTAAVLSAAEVKIDLNNVVIVRRNARQRNLANDLRAHLELMGGCKIKVVGLGKVPPGKYAFYLGIAPRGLKENFKPEEGRYLITEKAAYFYGDSAKELGVSHAVYSFLEDSLGVRWPGLENISLVKRNPVIVSKVEGNFIPGLNLRNIRRQGIWMARMKLGRHDPPVYGHAFTDWWKRFHKTNPEYFALNYGRRYPTNQGRILEDAAQNVPGHLAEMIALCVSNEKVWDQVVADWRKAGMPLYINLCENDAPDNLSCHCENCKKLDVLTAAQQKDWTHALADRYLVFARGVLAKAKKYRKDVKIAMYAYNASQDAPKREKVPDEVVIGIVPTNYTMDSLADYVLSWKKMGLKHFFYRPNRHTYYKMLVFPAGFHKYFFDVAKFMIEQGGIGFDYGSPTSLNPSVQLSDYLIAKAMQDPSKPYEYWMNHYLEAYGPAGKEVGNYFEYWRKEVWEKRIEKNLNKITSIGGYYNYGRGLCRSLKDYYRKSDFVTAGSYLEKALNTPGINDLQKAQVERLLKFHEHSVLFFNAVANRTDKDSIALLKFREKNNIKIVDPDEHYFGDVAGLERVQNLKEFDLPYLETDLLWKFRLDPEDKGVKEKWYQDGRNILKWKHFMATNGNWEKPHAGYKKISAEIRKMTAKYDGIGWYATSISIPSDWFGKRDIFLYFGAVDESCTVYVNGEKVHERPFRTRKDWMTPFTVDITKYVKGNSRTPQVIIVRVQDRAGAGGIWKRVRLVSKIKKQAEKK